MNSDFHEQFAALCAIYYSDEITEEEWALLQVHMAYCDQCKQRFLDYQQLTKDVIPMLAAASAADMHLVNESPEAQREAADRLMSSLDGLPQDHKPSSKPNSRRWMPITAACLLLCLAGASALLLRHRATLQPYALLTPQKTSTALPPSADNAAQQQLLLDQSEIQTLHQQLSAEESKSAHFATKDQAGQRQIVDDQAQIERLTSERDSLAGELSSSQAESQTLRERLTSFESGASQSLLKVASLETKVRDLNDALEDAKATLSERERILAVDQEFLSHDRDVRDLIGARNLYIADVYDTTENGRSKPFARVFYTRDRSLIFYGFDLEKQSGLKQDTAFQVWGSGSDQSPVSLGFLYQDENHNRWVMRFDDPKTLARLNMVFVTVEPPGGSRKPTGKQLLRAMLQIPPNHP